MAETFYAARYVDSVYMKELPVFPVDATSKESVEQAIDAITHSNHTPEQIKGMLGTVLANAGDLFSEEEKTNVFADAQASEEPFAIELTKDNMQLLYTYVEQSDPANHRIEYVAVVDSYELDEKDAEIAKLKVELEAANAEETAEEAVPDAEQPEDEQPEAEAVATEATVELTADVTPAAATTEDTQDVDSIVSEKTSILTSRIEELEGQITAKDATISSLKAAIAELRSYQHESQAREAANLATKLGKPLARDKSFDDLCAMFASRTDESLKDTIADYKLEASTEDEASEEETDQLVIEAVTPPVGSIDDRPGATSLVPDNLADQLRDNITVETESVWDLWIGNDGIGTVKKISSEESNR